jgi:hypothetical protein
MNLYFIVSVILFFWMISSFRRALTFVVLVCCLSLASYTTLAIPHSGDAHRPFYLLQPYLNHAFMQSATVLGYLGLAVGLHGILSLFGRSGLAALAVGGIAVVTLPKSSLASQNPRFNLTPRVSVCGTMGCVTPADHAAMAFLQELSEGVLAKYRGLSYEEMPKVLILGHPVELGLEKWIFPQGASRLVPLVSKLPVAFFYGRGSSSWTFENYRNRVCLQFDIEWLKRRNIRYLFMGTENPGCLRGRQRVFSESTVLFEKNGARVLQLF